jgi:hypothetical protein
MIKILLCLILLVVFINLVGCQKTASQEVIRYETMSDLYMHFTSDPQAGKERLIKNYGQGTGEILQSLLLSQEKPSEATLKAFSQLFAEAYHNATDVDLSNSENETYAQILGITIGSLSALRQQVIVKRKARLLAWQYDYTEIDKRWLALFADIISLAPSYKSSEDIIKIAGTGVVNKFAESVLESNYAKQIQGVDLVDEMIHEVGKTAIANFNGYRQKTRRSLGTTFKAAWVMARSNMKSLTD